MSEATSISFNVAVDGTRRGSVRRMLTLGQIIEWIKAQGFDEFTTKGLIELASKYPNNALPLFKKNFNLMLQRVRAKRQKDNEGNAPVEVKEEPVVYSVVTLDEGLNANWKGNQNEENNSEEAVDQEAGEEISNQEVSEEECNEEGCEVECPDPDEFE